MRRTAPTLLVLVLLVPVLAEPRRDRFGAPLPAAAVDRLVTSSNRRQRINRVRFSPDGAQFVAQVNDPTSTIEVWDSTTLRSVSSVGRFAGAADIAFAGTALLVTAQDGVLHRLDAVTGTELARLPATISGVLAVSSKSVLAREGVDAFKMVDPVTLAPGPAFGAGASHGGDIVALSPDGELVVSGADVYSTRTGQLTRRIDTKLGTDQARFSPDGKLVARRVRTEDHVASIELHETKTWALVATIPIEGPFAFAPTSDKLFVAAVHREWQGPRVASGVETYSTKGKLLARWEDQEQLGSTHVECSPDGRLVVLTPGLRVFEAATGRQILLEGLGVDQRPFAFTKDGAALFTRGEHPRAIHRFSLATGLPSVLVRSDELNGPVAASPDGKSVACLLDTRKITIVDGTSGVTLGVLDDAGVNGGVIDMAFSPDGKLVAAVYHDARLRVFDLATWKLRFSAGCEATNVAWPDGGKTVVGFSEEAFSFFGAAKGELRKRVQRVKVRPKPAKAEFGFTEEPAITGTALSPDGKLAAFRFEATLELVSTETGRSVARLDTKSLSHQAGSVAFSPDSRRVVTAGAGYGATCVWDVAARRKVLEVNACNVVGSCREFDGACWSADGQRLASLGCDGLYLWDVR